MTTIIQKRILIALKILTVISFLCIIVDNGKFEISMALVLALPFLISVPFGGENDWATALFSLWQILYTSFFLAALLQLFITAVNPIFSKRAALLSTMAIIVLWVPLVLAAPTSFAYPSLWVVVTHAIFACLSLATLVFIRLLAKRLKRAGP